MARALMFVGTGSESGKSVLAAAFCRLLHRRGIRVAPFKAQNMALNSGVTPDGREMGRAQIVQAEAAGIAPQVDMNPVLLKPVAEQGSQVVVRGVAGPTMSAGDYYQEKKRLWSIVTESYDSLARQYEVIVLEGAGSPVEVNLKDNDIVNMAMAAHADAAVLLVADIDRGGVFASIVGTMELLTPQERERVIGFIINKFRGDAALLRDGLQFLETKTGRPVFGVVPMLKDLYIPGEDSVSLDRPAVHQREWDGAVTVGIIRLPHLSNYTDFDPLLCDPRFSAQYLTTPRQVLRCDVCIIPGSKNVAADLLFLCERGFDRALQRYHEQGGRIAGICGGYQMLGRRIHDPHGVESDRIEMEGLGLLPVVSTMHTTKTTLPVQCRMQLPGGRSCTVAGYEIHMGTTHVCEGAGAQHISPDHASQHVAGIASADGTVWGTYVHGLFDNDTFRDLFLTWAGGRVDGTEAAGFCYRGFKEKNYDMLADAVERHVGVARIFKSIGL